MMWLAFLAAQLFVLARLALKLQFVASQTALFQASLAHARYVARPAAALAGIPGRRVRGVSWGSVTLDSYPAARLAAPKVHAYFARHLTASRSRHDAWPQSRTKG